MKLKHVVGAAVGASLLLGASRGCQMDEKADEDARTLTDDDEGTAAVKVKKSRSTPSPTTQSLGAETHAVQITEDEVGDEFRDPSLVLIGRLRDCINRKTDGNVAAQNDLNCSNLGGGQMWCRNPSFQSSTVDFSISEAAGEDENDIEHVIAVKVGETTAVYPVDMYTDLKGTNEVLTEICLATRNTLQDLDPNALCNPETADEECQAVVDKAVDEGGYSVYKKEVADAIAKEMEEEGFPVERKGPFDINVGPLRAKIVTGEDGIRIAAVDADDVGLVMDGVIAHSKAEALKILKSGALPPEER